jgi:asparagine synthetase B (glutamine-hydrolysing)
MAYFVAHRRGPDDPVAELDGLVADLAGQAGADRSTAVGDRRSAARSWRSAAPLGDIAMQDAASGSYLLVVGAPLVAGRYRTPAGGPALLRDLLADPARCLRDHLDGCFALVAYDGEKDVLLAATDINRTVPVFYARLDGGVVLASSELALARAARAGIEPAGFAQAIFLGTTWSDVSRFSGLRKLNPAELLTCHADGSLSTRRFWRPAEESEWDDGFETVLERWGGRLAGVVQGYAAAGGGEALQTDFTAGEDARLLVAQCHAAGIPFEAHVTGFPGDTDVVFAEAAAAELGFPLRVTPQQIIDADTLARHAQHIAVASDGYEHYFKACMRFARSHGEAPSRCVHLGGIPGGEAFRGAYYLRAKLFLPGRRGRIDAAFFTRLKFLLDHVRGLLAHDDEAFLAAVRGTVAAELEEVRGFATGTQVDHLLRMLQTCGWGMNYRQPAYLPLASSGLTRSIYRLRPAHKRGGRLTKALTEKLYPELAWLPTQNGVPTVRKTWRRAPLFWPEYAAGLRRVWRGFSSRILRVNQQGRTLQGYLRLDYNRPIFAALFEREPYAAWFRSPGSMHTGGLYRAEALAEFLSAARQGRCDRLNTLARIIAQELACRWVAG